MATYTASFPVTAEPEKAFAYLADFRNANAWSPAIVSVKPVGVAPLGLGSEFDGVFTFYGRQFDLRYQVTEWVESERVVLVADSKRAHARDVISLVNDGVGSVVSYEAEFRFGGLLSIFDKGLQVAFESIGKRSVTAMTKALAR